jgi:pimeloyl-ACP methyl ester carboxylesterase
MQKQLKIRSKKSTNVRFINFLTAAYGKAINGLALVAPALAVRFASRLFFATHRHPRWNQDPVLKTAKTFEVPQGGQTVRFYAWGHGPTVLLVHGWNGWGAQLSQLVPPLLEKGYRILTFDALGHGGSEGKSSNIFKFADGIALADKIAGPFYAIITHSMGGAATTLALKDGVRAKRLVYLAPPFDPSGWLGRFVKTLRINEKVGWYLEESFRETFGERWKFFQDPRFIRDMKTPLLVIHDRNDSQVHWEEGKRLAAAWQGANFHGTEGLGHNRLLKDADVIQRTVDFIHPPKLLTDKKTVKGESHENTTIPLAEELFQSVYA